MDIMELGAIGELVGCVQKEVPSAGKLAGAGAGGAAVPSLHTSEFAPDLRPTLETGSKSLIGLTLSVLAPSRR